MGYLGVGAAASEQMEVLGGGRKVSHQELSDTSDPKPSGDCSPLISVHQGHEDRDSLAGWDMRTGTATGVGPQG